MSPDVSRAGVGKGVQLGLNETKDRKVKCDTCALLSPSFSYYVGPVSVLHSELRL